jgi:hypothetical protein
MANCYCQARKFYRIRPFILVVFATIVGCVSPARHAHRLARGHGLQPLLLQGTSYQHHAFAALRDDAGMLVLFIDGDGSPWTKGGRQVAADPTPRAPLALELAVETPAAVLYLGRPCYLEAPRPPQCTPAVWTSGRYSTTVVASMSAAANAFIAEHHFASVLLVGYSGGGTLAALMAPQVRHVAGVVSIAGNLDPAAWTRLHGYLPLDESLNPALQPPLPDTLKQWYLVGGRDNNVPAAVAARYLQRIRPERLWSYPEFDHVCCWKREWPGIFARITTELNSGEGSR